MFKNEKLEADLINEIDNYFKDNKDKDAIQYAKFIEESPLRQKIYQIYRELEVKHIFKFNQDFIAKHFIDQSTNIFKHIRNIFNDQDFSTEKENSLKIINNLFEESLKLKKNNEINFKQNQLGLRKLERREIWKEFSIDPTEKQLKKTFNSMLSKDSKYLNATYFSFEKENINILFSLDKNQYWKCVGFIFNTENGKVFLSFNQNITLFINKGAEIKCISSSTTRRAYYNDEIHSETLFTRTLPIPDIKGYHKNKIENYNKEGEYTQSENILVSEKKSNDKIKTIEFRSKNDIIFKHYSYLNNENKYWILSKYNDRKYTEYFSEEYYEDIEGFIYNSNSSFIIFSEQLCRIVEHSFPESIFENDKYDFIFKTNLIDRIDEFHELIELNTSD